MDTIWKLIKGVTEKISNILTLIKQIIKKAKEVPEKGVTFMKKTNVTKNRIQTWVNRLKR